MPFQHSSELEMLREKDLVLHTCLQDFENRSTVGDPIFTFVASLRLYLIFNLLPLSSSKNSCHSFPWNDLKWISSIGRSPEGPPRDVINYIIMAQKTNY